MDEHPYYWMDLAPRVTVVHGGAHAALRRPHGWVWLPQVLPQKQQIQQQKELKKNESKTRKEKREFTAVVSFD